METVERPGRAGAYRPQRIRHSLTPPMIAGEDEMVREKSEKMREHFAGHYAAAAKMVRLGPGQLALLCSAFSFDLVVLDGGQVM